MVRHSSFCIRHSFPISSRLELRRALSFSDGARDRNISEFGAIDGTAQKKTTATHIAATDEICRETKPLTKMLEQNLDVLRSRNTAEKNDFALRRHLFCKFFHIALQGQAIPRIGFIDIDRREFLKVGEADWAGRRNQTAGGSDDKHGRASSARRRKGVCIGELAAKVQPAAELEQLADRRAAPLKLVRHREARVRPQQETHPLATGTRRREQENAWRRHRHDGTWIARLHAPPPARKLTAIMRRLLLLTAFSLCACHWYRGVHSIVTQDDVEELESNAADDLACPEDRVESRPLTLLTRIVEGCGHQRVYAYDPLRERWIVASVEKR